MDVVAVLGGATPSPSISLLATRNVRLSHTSYCRSGHLAAFRSPSHLFIRRPSSRNLHKSHIFLPHLVASMEEVEGTYIIIKPGGVQLGSVEREFPGLRRRGLS